MEKELLEELLNDQTFKTLLAQLTLEVHYPMNLPMHGMIPGEIIISIADILTQLPDIFKTTSVFELGIVLGK